MIAALQRKERALFVTFDETKHIFRKRAAGMGWDLGPDIEAGRLILEQVDRRSCVPASSPA